MQNYILFGVLDLVNMPGKKKFPSAHYVAFRAAQAKQSESSHSGELFII
jgi:hypothetical protein